MATQTRTSIPLNSTSTTSHHSLTSTSHSDQSQHDPPPPPISRKKQSSVVASAFVALALTIGYNQCYGVFQEYYLSPNQDILVSSSSSPESKPVALLAFVGTLCYGLTWAGGILVNPIISRIEHGRWSATSDASSSSRPLLPAKWKRKLLTNRTITVSGVLMMVAGFGLASLSTQVWHLLLTQGFLVGLGMSLVYFPLLAPAPEYFTSHRATAMGVILAGGGAGGLALSPLFRLSLTTLGGRWTLRIYALFNLIAGLPIAWSVPRSRFAATSPTTADADTSPTSEDPNSNGTMSRPNTHISRSLSLRPTFYLSCIASFLQAAGAQTPLAFIPSYTTDKLGLDASTGANFLATANAINAVARIITGYCGDRLGRQNTLILALLLSACSVFVFWGGSIYSLPTTQPSSDVGGGSTSEKLWIAFIVMYSFGAGGYYALFPALIAEVFGIRAYAAVNAFILFVRGLGTMFGSPVGGQLLGSKRDEYAGLAFWDGALLMASVVCCFGVRWADARGKGWRWVA